MRAVHIISRAAELVGGDRAKTHGDMHKLHDNVAILWNAFLACRKEPEGPIRGQDVAMLMALLKMARTQNGGFNADDYVDLAGYAGIAGELALEPEQIRLAAAE